MFTTTCQQLATHLDTLRYQIQRWLDERSTPDREQGSHTTDVILWAVAIVVIVGIAVAALTMYVQTQAAKLK